MGIGVGTPSRLIALVDAGEASLPLTTSYVMLVAIAAS